MSESVKIKLSTPINAHGEEVSELTMRKPGGKEIRKCGFPMKGDGTIDTEAAAKYISELCAIPPSSVDALSAEDWIEAMTVAVNFLGGSPPTSSTSSET